MWKLVLPALVLAVLVLLFQGTESCNEAVCGSVVSKCLLTRSCNCDFNFSNCTCCKECMSCLSYLYSECCSCVDMCPKPNLTGNSLSRKSHVEDYTEKVPGLFAALTESPDPEEKWNSTTFPIDIDVGQYVPRKQDKYYMKTSEQDVLPQPHIITRNCTVAFWSKCMSWTKCKSSCLSMGASSYRWFHDGCCECVGEYCINYGINESRCQDCPKSEEEIVDEDINNLDFGEDDDYYENEMDL